MVTLQEKARALGDPTRHAIFTLVADSEVALGVRDLTSELDLHPNAVRQHLRHLVRTGLLTEEVEPPRGRGRPRHVYSLDATAAGTWGTDGPYEELSGLLAEVITSGRSPEEVGRRAVAREPPAPSPARDAVASVTVGMAERGFAPEVREVDGGIEVALGRCPFASTAADARSTVCAIHLGIAEGLLDGHTATVRELVAKDPHRAGCVLHIALDGDDDPGPAVLTLRPGTRGGSADGT